MIFLDSTGFYGLVGLLVQCGLSWLLVGIFAVLRRHGCDAEWFRCWLVAFASLAVALTAVAVRFSVLNAEWTGLFEERQPATLAVHVVYQTGKLSFLWHLLAGIQALRGRPVGPRLLALGAGIAVYAVAGGLFAPTIEALLFMQAPVVVLVMGWSSWSLARVHSEQRDPGSRIVGYALATWAVLWTLYSVPLLGSELGRVVGPSLSVRLLRLTSYCDIVVEVALGAGSIAMVLQDAYRAKLAAIAERDRLREVLLRDEKLRAIGTLVSGVAHELNNPLTSVIGFASELDSDDPQIRRKAAQVVREQAERCGAIVQNLSLLSSQQPQRQDALDVDELVARVARGFAPQLSAVGVDLHVDGAAPGATVLGDRVGLERILANLIGNALHAAPLGSRITVAVRRTRESIDLEVIDAGPGVPAWVAGRLFEPFFTTKPPGQGVGLGLSMARSLARAHGGDLGLVPQGHGEGARFRLTLPLASGGSRQAARATFHTAAPVGRRVLIVDDESMVRGVLARQAELRGWHVTEAIDGEVALSLLQQTAAPDVVVCDLRMPRLSGSALHDRLAAQAPHLLERFIFITGDSASSEARAFTARCRRPVLQKPIDFALLFAEAARVVA